MIRPEYRNKGIGKRFIRFIEDHIFADQPNVFSCASSFNPYTKAWHEKSGYAIVGELPDYLLKGHKEYIFRKSVASIVEFEARK